MIYTANYATKKDEEQAKDLGADDFITRPIDEEQLTTRIKQVVDRAREGRIAQPRAKPQEGFFREYSSLLIEKLEDQLITAEENRRLLAKNAELQHELETKNRALRATNEELVRVNGDLEAFTYSVSHDLRTPVRAIDGMARLLARDAANQLTSEARHYVDRIEYNVKRMDALITGLLAHSRMRNVGAAMSAVSLETAVKIALAGLDYAIRESKARVHIAGALPVVVAHEEALVQVITNLVGNAVKFVAAGTEPAVEISAHDQAGRIRVEVRDNGIGIDPAHQEKLFQVFERLHPDSRYPGTGLGLAIVKRGIERMGGRVGLESQAGQGSTFWFELPSAAPARTATHR